MSAHIGISAAIRFSSVVFLVILLAVLSQDGNTFGDVAHAAAPSATTVEVDQSPDGPGAVPIGTHVIFTVSVTLSAPQPGTQAMTIQLASGGNLGNLVLTCTSGTNGNADQTGSGGPPSCMWLGPVLAGTFTFVFEGDTTGPVADVIPHASSVVCTDTNNSNTCGDELAGDKVALVDISGDVGALSVASNLPATSEVNQTPVGGSTVPAGTSVTYTAIVTLTGATQALTIQLKDEANLTGRSLSCTSSVNGAADATQTGGTPRCQWNSPNAAGTFALILTGTMSGAIGDVIPNATSLACIDTNANNNCSDETIGNIIDLADQNGDVGPLTVSTAPSATSEVTQVPVGGSTVALGTRVTYTATVSLAVLSAQAVTIQLRGDANLINRTLVCTSSTNGVADIATPAGVPTCRWDGPVSPGTLTFVFAGDVAGAIADAIPDPASVICTDASLPVGCSDEPASGRIALADANGDVGPLTLSTAPVATTEVNQSPAGGASVANGTPITYTITVVLSAPQAQAMTVQLLGDGNIISRVLACTSTTNGNADVTNPAGSPSCMWLGPVAAGTFTMTFRGVVMGAVGDAVPSAVSVVCTDTNASNNCGDDPVGGHLALSDADGDVGPVGFITSFRLVVPMVSRDGVPLP